MLHHCQTCLRWVLLVGELLRGIWSVGLRVQESARSCGNRVKRVEMLYDGTNNTADLQKKSEGDVQNTCPANPPGCLIHF
jgi:hypothetical protein